jgi:hypothetical protein
MKKAFAQGDEVLNQEPRRRTPQRSSGGGLAMAPLHDTRCPGIDRGDRGGAAARHTEQWIEDFVGEEKKNGR